MTELRLLNISIDYIHNLLISFAISSNYVNYMWQVPNLKIS